MSLPAAVHAAPAAAQEPSSEAEEKRDWVAWYDGLDPEARRTLRDRIVGAAYDTVRDDPELRTFFLFHVEDLAEEGPPGTRRIRELWAMTQTFRGHPELAAERRKVVGHLLVQYQAYLVDNPWSL